jgi:hypothetical protein
VPIAPLSNEVMAPEPSRSEPFHVAVAVRVVMINLQLMLLRPRSIIGGIPRYYACWAELPTPIGE